MSLTIVLDTDFLSAFLKVEHLQRIRDLYRVERVLLPPAVYREVSVTSLLPRLAALRWIEVGEPSSEPSEAAGSETWKKLGPGEQQAIALALASKPSVLLTNDGQAGRVAKGLGLEVVNIPAFLFACKIAGLLGLGELADLVRELEEKDRYSFRRDLRQLLLS